MSRSEDEAARAIARAKEGRVRRTNKRHVEVWLTPEEAEEFDREYPWLAPRTPAARMEAAGVVGLLRELGHAVREPAAGEPWS